MTDRTATRGESGRSRLDYETPDGDARVCEHCGRPYAGADLLALHRGQAHPDHLTDEQRRAFEAAYEDEQAAIRRFRLKVLGALILIYFGFLIVYAVV